MYYSYFGLEEAPFSIAVNPRYLYMSPRHREALAHLLYGVGAGGGFILLTGEVGTGKTTINRCFLEQLPENTDVAMVLNPALDDKELLATVCDELSVDYGEGEPSLKTLTDALHQFLLANFEKGRKTVLMIDEAQHLSFDVLEQIRLLTNLETHTEKLLQIMLIGQPELAQMLAKPELRQLSQRITARYELTPLNKDETRAYVGHRLQVAGLGAGTPLFTDKALAKLQQLSGGVPRLINVICDRALLGAYGQQQTQVTPALLEQAAGEVLGHTHHTVELSQFRYLLPLLAVSLAALLIYAWPKFTSGGFLVSTKPAQEAHAVSATETSAAKPAEHQMVEPSAPVAAVNWRLEASIAWPVLWSLYSPLALPDVPCNDQAPYGLGCQKQQLNSWEALMALDHPALLTLSSGEVALALGANEEVVWFYHRDGGVEPVARKQLQGLWTGEYTALWRVPKGFRKPQALGSRSAAVAPIAQLFAELDAQETPLATERFTPELAERVRLFQRAHGLDDDGVVGAQTLQALNIALGVSPDNVTARARLAAGSK